MSDVSAPSSPPRHLDKLSVDECLARLATEAVGRLALVVDHYPQIYCVNYRLDDFVVVFRTHLGSHLLQAQHANIAFEVDHLEPATRLGWTVVIQGMAEDVTDRSDDVATTRGRELDIKPWAPGSKPRIVRVIPARITGRELIPGEAPWATDGRGYL